jgi:hypothetical protein
MLGAQVKCVSCMLYLVAVFQACWLIRESPRDRARFRPHSVGQPTLSFHGCSAEMGGGTLCHVVTRPV